MPGPFTILARVDCWEATLNRQRPHSCHGIGAEPAPAAHNAVGLAGESPAVGN